jgi:hypothetical protein
MAYDWGQNAELARLCFGREAETLDLIGRLRSEAAGRFLVVCGASGSGKSSLVKAGLWRALADPDSAVDEPIPGCRDWVISAMTPTLDGDAFLTLVNSVLLHWRGGRLRPRDEADNLRRNPGAFPGFLDRLLAGRPAWLLILDQLEEVFSPEAEPYRDAFLDLLLGAVTDPRYRVVATLRADFQPQVIAHDGLRRVLNGGGTYYVGAPGPLALARMIEGTAHGLSGPRLIGARLRYLFSQDVHRMTWTLPAVSWVTTPDPRPRSTPKDRSPGSRRHRSLRPSARWHRPRCHPTSRLRQAWGAGSGSLPGVGRCRGVGCGS